MNDSAKSTPKKLLRKFKFKTFFLKLKTDITDIII